MTKDNPTPKDDLYNIEHVDVHHYGSLQDAIILLNRHHAFFQSPQKKRALTNLLAQLEKLNEYFNKHLHQTPEVNKVIYTLIAEAMAQPEKTHAHIQKCKASLKEASPPLYNALQFNNIWVGLFTGLLGFVIELVKRNSVFFKTAQTLSDVLKQTKKLTISL